MRDNWLNGIDPSGLSWLTNMLSMPWNLLKEVGGLFAYNTHQTFGGNLIDYLSRFTWQAPQEAAGFAIGVSETVAGLVDKVRYYDGATIPNLDALIKLLLYAYFKI